MRLPVRIAAAIAIGVAAVYGLGAFTNLLPNLGLPLTTTTVDRSQPPVLQAVSDIGEYRAATGTFQVVVDIERDTRFVPSFIKGERTVMVAVGTVDAGIDFAQLPPRAVRPSADGNTVTVTLPAATRFAPRVDPERSTVAGRSRGLVDRVSSVFSSGNSDDRALLARANDKMAEAAQADPGLEARAQANVRAMLTELLGAAGFERVQVEFAVPTEV